MVRLHGLHDVLNSKLPLHILTVVKGVAYGSVAHGIAFSSLPESMSDQRLLAASTQTMVWSSLPG